MWLNSKKIVIPTKLSIKWSARWIRPFRVKKILNPDVCVLDLGMRVGKTRYAVFYVSELKKYRRDEKDWHLWQEDPMSPPKYQLWDGAVDKVTTIFDSR